MLPSEEIKPAELKHLNHLLGEKFGYVPNPAGGRAPRFKWQRSEETFFFVRNGVQCARSAGGIEVVLPRFDRVSVAEIHGPCWVFLSWNDMPVETESDWSQHVGTQFAWSDKGDYQAVMVLPAGVAPDRLITGRIIEGIERQMGLTDDQKWEGLVNDTKAPMEAAQKQWNDVVDDAWAAFDNNNIKLDRLGESRGGNVSVGGV